MKYLYCRILQIKYKINIYILNNYFNFYRYSFCKYSLYYNKYNLL